jgi:CspA family cold shock protein
VPSVGDYGAGQLETRQRATSKLAAEYDFRRIDDVKGRSMATGTVKWFNATKGYGFIQPSDGSQDAFVHISAVERAGLTGLNEGQKVEYDLVPGRDGKSAADNLVVLD